jgi:hypothetical protein
MYIYFLRLKKQLSAADDTIFLFSLSTIKSGFVCFLFSFIHFLAMRSSQSVVSISSIPKIHWNWPYNYTRPDSEER